ncbi:TIR domain-containing protein [Variovorax sp. J31P207]|uniref:TIR domain-containing protein n=1 Tax=Variovorax sp. J31P207 TaxID=3053510 RepID=UPI002575B713|nr:TIR domain-containing protein [Variovorax sp. J31P207]MDM0069694.1 TIR domain-containing protein [Variovorax sp. J31P207]
MPDATEEVFFSYSRSDEALVLKIASALRRDGRRVWVDQIDIAKGARWDDEVEKALKASSCLLAILSPAAVASQNVMDEVSYALGEKKKVIPVLSKQCDIPFRLKRLQFVDFTGDYDKGYRELSSALDGGAAPPRKDDGVPPGASSRRTQQALIGGAVVVVAAVAGYVVLDRPTPAPAPAPVVVAPSPPAVQPAPVVVKREPEPAPVAPPVQPAPVAPPPPAPPPVIAAAPPPAPVFVPPPAPAPMKQAVASDRQLTDFVHRYISTQNRSSPNDLVAFYADEVEYFNEKHATRAFILKDRLNFQRRWPEVDNRLAGPIDIDRSSGDGTAVLSYTIRYGVRSLERGDSKSGMARDELRVRPVDGQLLIVGQHQKILNAQAN